ncbi:unnamed protein product [Phytophthora fragariaefolia]|uniref:Unnamed protein product n=1 Tax=Phytophthora fragariaefolia TaxID=1490495 RepID=A0A9W7DBR5_9STRA|nr:unnamed protein product [Phytophthora fragariaefolia]
MLRVRGKNNLCADDGGGRSNGATKFVDMTCDPNSPNQIFTYDMQTHQFKSVNKPGLCMDDGGGWNAGETAAHLWECDPNNQNQWFTLDKNNMLRNPVKPNLCFDDGGGMNPGETRYWLWSCDDSNPNQHFEIIAPSSLPAPQPDTNDLLSSGQPVMLRVRGKNSLCADDGGGRSNGATKFVDMTCDPNSPNQIFTYDMQTHQFKSVNKPGLLVHSGQEQHASQPSEAELMLR